MKKVRSFLAVLICLLLMLQPAALAESQQDIYVAAQNYLVSGQYDLAAAAFDSVRTYQDSHLYLMYCKACQFAEKGLYDFALSSFKEMLI